MKTALVTGITGQDGAYLAQHLLDKGYRVFGMTRRTTASEPDERLVYLGIHNRVQLISGDLHDLSSLIRVLEVAEPHEVYNLAAQSFVHVSFHQPLLTGDVTGLGTGRILEAIRLVNPEIRFYQASSSEMFGNVTEADLPLAEHSRFRPSSPYAAAKVFAHWMTVNYREAYGIFACCGILFNHESPLRGIEFVTRKISDGVAKIHLGLEQGLRLGTLDSRRDWGFSGDYVEAMWLMLQQDAADDYVIATGEDRSVRDILELAFGMVGKRWQDHVTQDPALFRPSEVPVLRGDARKAETRLGWRRRMALADLIALMVKADLERYQARLTAAGRDPVRLSPHDVFVPLHGQKQTLRPMVLHEPAEP